MKELDKQFSELEENLLELQKQSEETKDELEALQKELAKAEAEGRRTVCQHETAYSVYV